MVHGDAAAIVLDHQPLDGQPRGARGPAAMVARGVRFRNLARAHHHLGQVGGRQVGHAALAGEPAATQHRDRVGEGHHLAELVGDQQHGDVTRLRHRPQHPQHLVGLGRRQHRGRLVEDHEAAFQVELLEDLDLLLLARRQPRHRRIEVDVERHRGHERGQPRPLLRPAHDDRHVVARHHEVLGHRHARYQREVLVDHADAERVGVVRRADVSLAAADHDAAGIGLVVADQALHQRALAGAVLAQQRVEAARRHLQGDGVQGGERAEALRHAQDLDVEGGE